MVMSEEKLRQRIAAILPRIKLERWPWEVHVFVSDMPGEVIAITEVRPDRGNC
jgi:hypothetical protein